MCMKTDGFFFKGRLTQRVTEKWTKHTGSTFPAALQTGQTTAGKNVRTGISSLVQCSLSGAELQVHHMRDQFKKTHVKKTTSPVWQNRQFVMLQEFVSMLDFFLLNTLSSFILLFLKLQCIELSGPPYL